MISFVPEKKIVITDPPWREFIDLQLIIKILGGRNSTKLVGGVVRDAIRGENIKDIDLATKISPKKTARILRDNSFKVIDYAQGHGTISVLSKNGKSLYQITTLRKDIDTDGRHAKVIFTREFYSDVIRRDFTINSIYADFDGKLYDPLGGIKDLNQSKIKFIGDPDDRIKEDRLRILRYFRFLSYYCDKREQVEINSLKSCIKNFNAINHLSRERVRGEFVKLIEGNNPSFPLKIMKKNNLLDIIIPKLNDVRIQDIYYLKKIPGKCLIKLAYLALSANIDMIVVSKYLSLSNKTKNHLIKISANLNLPVNILEIKKNIYKMGAELAKDNYILLSSIASKRPSKDILKFIDKWQVPKFPINGNDIVKTGIKDGAQIGKISKLIEEWWIEGGFSADRAKCLIKINEIEASI